MRAKSAPPVGIRVKSCAKAVTFDHPYEQQIRQWPRPYFGKIQIFSWAELQKSRFLGSMRMPSLGLSALGLKVWVIKTLPTDKSGFSLNMDTPR